MEVRKRQILEEDCKSLSDYAHAETSTNAAFNNSEAALVVISSVAGKNECCINIE